MYHQEELIMIEEFQDPIVKVRIKLREWEENYIKFKCFKELSKSLL